MTGASLDLSTDFDGLVDVLSSLAPPPLSLLVVDDAEVLCRVFALRFSSSIARRISRTFGSSPLGVAACVSEDTMSLFRILGMTAV